MPCPSNLMPRAPFVPPLAVLAALACQPTVLAAAGSCMGAVWRRHPSIKAAYMCMLTWQAAHRSSLAANATHTTLEGGRAQRDAPARSRSHGDLLQGRGRWASQGLTVLRNTPQASAGCRPIKVDAGPGSHRAAAQGDRHQHVNGAVPSGIRPSRGRHCPLRWLNGQETAQTRVQGGCAARISPPFLRLRLQASDGHSSPLIASRCRCAAAVAACCKPLCFRRQPRRLVRGSQALGVFRR